MLLFKNVKWLYIALYIDTQNPLIMNSSKRKICYHFVTLLKSIYLYTVTLIFIQFYR
ncbi:hypothetical protein LM13656_80051 [Listeria monocytogenes]|nr:hypothetical protein LM1000505_70185 [Listeria monocytogenes]CUK34736.1 hypothetical protein LM500008_200108 [Listeria monocytogenes]CUK40011.1 hypothetical protein LM13656_80051 [Listeria monocytogenes]CUK40762.1 hypothetical protein LM500172_170108 [Listeria monocytogenes]CUK44570.1 hypothetical protein LM500190_200109 [Listeria monocytogenes]